MLEFLIHALGLYVTFETAGLNTYPNPMIAARAGIEAYVETTLFRIDDWVARRRNRRK